VGSQVPGGAWEKKKKVLRNWKKKEKNMESSLQRAWNKSEKTQGWCKGGKARSRVLRNRTLGSTKEFPAAKEGKKNLEGSNAVTQTGTKGLKDERNKEMGGKRNGKSIGRERSGRESNRN